MEYDMRKNEVGESPFNANMRKKWLIFGIHLDAQRCWKKFLNFQLSEKEYFILLFSIEYQIIRAER